MKFENATLGMPEQPPGCAPPERKMTRVIPMVALRTFVTVARYCSMKQAGEILCISIGAVSQQVKGLEERLGKRLFQRNTQGLQLTASGKALYEKLAHPIECIEDLWSAMLGVATGHSHLMIMTSSSIASSWLIPRLPDFHAKWPDIEVSVVVSSKSTELKRCQIDVAVMYGPAEHPGHCVTPLWNSRLIPVCSPALLASGLRINAPQDCLRYPLLQDSDRINWKLWLSARDCVDQRAMRGTSFCDEALLIKAACAGQGIALVSDVLVAGEIAAGKLVQAIDTPWPVKVGYYLVIENERVNEWAINAFRDWIVKQAADHFDPLLGPHIEAMATGDFSDRASHAAATPHHSKLADSLSKTGSKAGLLVSVAKLASYSRGGEKFEEEDEYA